MGRCTTRPRGHERTTPGFADNASRAGLLAIVFDEWNRFRPESLGPFLGLTPSENSSGERRRQGAITKAGNSHARRLLIEAAWHQRRPPRLSVTLERRRTDKSLALRAQADRSARRLHGRWQALERRGKPRSIVVVAVARELAGHCWALATMEQPPPPTAQRERAHRRNDARSDPREHC